MVLGEAMARGLPIVTTKGGAAAQTVPDAAALKVPPGDALALRHALQTAITDSALRARLSRRELDACFDLAKYGRATKVVLKRALSPAA